MVNSNTFGFEMLESRQHVGRAPESCHYIKGNNVGGSMVVVSLNLLVDRGKHVGRAPEP